MLEGGDVLEKDLFAKRLRVLRNIRGMTQEQLAQAMGVYRQQVNRWEMGHRGISNRSLEKLCDVLGVSMAEFWDETFIPNGLPLEHGVGDTNAAKGTNKVPDVNERQRAVRCPRCNSIGNDEPDEDLLYCYNCGYPMYNICTGEEKHVNPPGARYCGRCAARTVWSMNDDELAAIGIPPYERDGRSTDSNG